MNIFFTESERRQLQKQRRDDEGYVKVTVVMLDAGRAVATVAQDLGLDEGMVYRYAEAFARLGLKQVPAARVTGLLGVLLENGKYRTLKKFDLLQGLSRAPYATRHAGRPA